MKTKLFLFTIFLLFINTSFSQEENKKIIVDVAEVDPEYPGGEEAMTKFIVDNFHYPKEAKKNNEQGTVYVQFVVNKDGTLSDIKIIKGVSKSIDEEAVRLVKSMPNWKPGMQNGKYVNVNYILPIRIINSKKKRKKKSKKKRKKEIEKDLNNHFKKD